MTSPGRDCETVLVIVSTGLDEDEDDDGVVEVDVEVVDGSVDLLLGVVDVEVEVDVLVDVVLSSASDSVSLRDGLGAGEEVVGGDEVVGGTGLDVVPTMTVSLVQCTLRRAYNVLGVGPGLGEGVVAAAEDWVTAGPSSSSAPGLGLGSVVAIVVVESASSNGSIGSAVRGRRTEAVPVSAIVYSGNECRQTSKEVCVDGKGGLRSRRSPVEGEVERERSRGQQSPLLILAIDGEEGRAHLSSDCKEAIQRIDKG